MASTFIALIQYVCIVSLWESMSKIQFLYLVTCSSYGRMNHTTNLFSFLNKLTDTIFRMIYGKLHYQMTGSYSDAETLSLPKVH